MDQEKAVTANQLLANLCHRPNRSRPNPDHPAAQARGLPFVLIDAKHLSPYLTRHLLRFVKFTTRVETESLQENLRLDP